MNASTIFPQTTTAAPITMDDCVVFLIERLGLAPEVQCKTHREICDSMDDWRGAKLDPTDIEDHCFAYAGELETLYPEEGVEVEFWTTRHSLAVYVRCYSNSDDWMDSQRAAVLREVIDSLPNHCVITAGEKMLDHMASKRVGNSKYRAVPYDAAPDEPSCILDFLEERGLAGNTKIINRCNIVWEPIYPVNLLCSQFQNGEVGFSLLFDDENVCIDLTEQEACLLNRFINDLPDDVLDCFEDDTVQEMLKNAVQKAIERQHRDVWSANQD